VAAGLAGTIAVDIRIIVMISEPAAAKRRFRRADLFDMIALFL
jgi:hypothetical protein